MILDKINKVFILQQREKDPLFLFKANSLQCSHHFVVELSLARMHSVGFFYFKF